MYSKQSSEKNDLVVLFIIYTPVIIYLNKYKFLYYKIHNKEIFYSSYLYIYTHEANLLAIFVTITQWKIFVHISFTL